MKHADKIAAAEAHLGKQHPALRKLIRAEGPCDEIKPSRGDDFDALAKSIVYQQLTGKVGTVFYNRVIELCGGELLDAEVLATIRCDKLRGVGLSNAKTDTMKALAQHVVSGQIDFGRLRKATDDEVVDAVTVVKGIGPWTAHMFLIFHLGRLDVWPTGDYGVQKGLTTLFGHPELLKPKELLNLGEPFRPYRSVLAWYGWKVADTPGRKES